MSEGRLKRPHGCPPPRHGGELPRIVLPWVGCTPGSDERASRYFSQPFDLTAHGCIRLVDRSLPGEVAKATTVLGDRHGVV